MRLGLLLEFSIVFKGSGLGSRACGCRCFETGTREVVNPRSRIPKRLTTNFQ